MAVTIVIGERPFEVAPYKLREMRLCAPFVEQMGGVAKRIDAAQKAAVAEGRPASDGENLTDLFELSRCLCEIISVGLVKIDEGFTADRLEEEFDLSYLRSLQTAVRELLKQSGLNSAGEKKAPTLSRKRAGPKADSQRNLEELSTS